MVTRETTGGADMPNDRADIIFMQTRLIRLASDKWKLSIDKTVDLFKRADLFDYIEDIYKNERRQISAAASDLSV